MSLMPKAPAHGTSSNARQLPGSVKHMAFVWQVSSCSAVHVASGSSETAPSGQPEDWHPQLPQAQQPALICCIQTLTTAGGGEWGGVNEGRVGRRAGRGFGRRGALELNSVSSEQSLTSETGSGQLMQPTYARHAPLQKSSSG